jgi:hypothetical protein
MVVIIIDAEFESREHDNTITMIHVSSDARLSRLFCRTPMRILDHLYVYFVSVKIRIRLAVTLEYVVGHAGTLGNLFFQTTIRIAVVTFGFQVITVEVRDCPSDFGMDFSERGG